MILARFKLKFWLVVAVFILIDQITKAFSSGRDFFVGPIHVRYVENYGLSFNLDFGSPWNLIMVFIFYILASILVLSVEAKSKWVKFGQTLFLAGAAANMSDRLLFGYVRDFIDLKLGFVFNLADVFIVIGVFLVLGFGKTKDKPQVTVQTEQK